MVSIKSLTFDGPVASVETDPVAVGVIAFGSGRTCGVVRRFGVVGVTGLIGALPCTGHCLVLTFWRVVRG